MQRPIALFWEGNGRWVRLLFLTVLSVYFYVFMEWLFFVTKPSFTSTVPLSKCAPILILSPLPLLLPVLSFLLSLWLCSRVVTGSRPRALPLAFARLGATLFLAATCFLLTENFTRTTIGFAVASSQGVTRIGYIFFVVFLLIWAFRFLSKLEIHPAIVRRQTILQSIGCGLLALSFLAFLAQANSHDEATRLAKDFISKKSDLPNILLISSDGLNSENMSVYGYKRDTTPYLKKLADESIVFHNAFANAGQTGASLTSILTGKLPTKTRLIYPPDILRGEDVYEHLPGILRNTGYRSLHISVRHYADPYDLNMRDSFDSSNYRSSGRAERLWFLAKKIGQESTYFLEKTGDRLQQRVFHLLALKKFDDVFTTLVEEAGEHRHDSSPEKRLLEFAGASQEPFFAQVHFLGTHGDQFYPTRQFFSKGKVQDKPWMTDFYDDAILEFDARLGRIVESLRSDGILDKTLLIFYSDHGLRYYTHTRTPLLIRLPRATRTAHIHQNVQNLDIAPTVLDFLELEKPDWMEGESLLSMGRPSSGSPLFSTNCKWDAVVQKNELWEMDPQIAGPPFYSLRYFSAIICNRCYMIDLNSPEISILEIPGHTDPCDPASFPPPQEAAALLIRRLAQDGYDVSSLYPPFPVIVDPILP